MEHDTLVPSDFPGAGFPEFITLQTPGRAQAQSSLSMQFPCLPHILPSCFLHVQPALTDTIPRPPMAANIVRVLEGMAGI